MSKKIDEMCGASSAQGAASDFFRKRRNTKGKLGAPFTEAAINPTGQAIVFPKRNKSGKGKTGKGKIAKLETKSESILREAIRNLIFLSRIKYHEEQAKIGIQEQKLRSVIKYLITEADDAQEAGLASTGQTAGYSFLKKIEKTTFQNDFQSLKSSEEQRTEFKKVYLTGIKIYLDTLDQQYLILNPDQRPGSQSAIPSPVSGPVPPDQSAAPDMGGLPPAKRRDLKEEAPVPGNIAPAASGVAAQSSMDTSNIQKQAVMTAVSATQTGTSDVTGRAAAETALKRDLPQIDPLYFNLTFKPITIKGAETNDRKEFRTFLIGDKEHVGNIQIKFKEWGDKAPIGGGTENNTPIIEVPPLEPQTPGTAPAAGAVAPPAGGAPLATPPV